MTKLIDIEKSERILEQINPIAKMLKLLREAMAKYGVDAWIVPTSDPHKSEYQAPHWQSRVWLTGFTGSAGTAVVLKDKVGLWTDGRYHSQAEKQLKGTGITLYKQGLHDVPDINTMLEDSLSEGSCIGYDGSLISAALAEEMEDKLKHMNVSFKTDSDLIDEIWESRPEIPKNSIFEHSVKFAGKSVSEKLNEVRNEMKKKKADWFLLSSLDDIAWLFNIRGSDLPNSPFVFSYALISADKACFCIDSSKVSKQIKENLNKKSISLAEYDEVYTLVSAIPAKDSVFLDENSVNIKLKSYVPSSCRIIHGTNITSRLKTIKNSIEIKHFKNCLVRDGIYVMKMAKWLEENIGKEEITELTVADKLKSLRSADEKYHGPSFTTIAGYASNGAQMHYISSEGTNKEIGFDSFLLVDSGAQYTDGTTDITRTFSFGEHTTQQIHDYTLVLKAFISMARTVFVRGTRGTQIDYAARADMWREGIHYKCATGHGVGFFLNVHEGPQNIGQRLVDEELKPGMVITNEPGIYRQGHHGVRIEDIMLCIEDKVTEFGTFYKFESMTVCPIDTRPVDFSLLSKDEIKWLNDYHAMVYEKMSPHLDEELRIYLKEKTKAVKP